MINVVLVAPEIPPNTGNIIRLCANTGAHLHLIKPLGFPLDDTKMKRAGLDYHEYAKMQVHENWSEFKHTCQPDMSRLFAMTTRGQRWMFTEAFKTGDWLVFGNESSGLPDSIRSDINRHQWLRLPMQPENRSLNLSNAVAIAVYEAWRQMDFDGAQ
jgi:tRNA (cytidine/uridine-2'-O-)-methyltransferase